MEPHSDASGVYDVFVSHSGAQKGFAKDLYRMLSPFYNTFLDIKSHCLPPGEPFPDHIFAAARQCRLALIVLSDEFVCSKWPMLELCTFIDARPPVSIIPLFYTLSPSDLTCRENLARWHTVWPEDDAECDVPKWPNALRTLRSLSGLEFSAREGHLTYLDTIVSEIFTTMAPAIQCDDHHIHGKVRLCKIITDKFKDMGLQEQPSPVAFVLGMYGDPGSGKSTLSWLLCDYFFSQFGSRVLRLDLPSNMNPSREVDVFKKLLELTSFQGRINLDKITGIGQVITLLKRHSLPRLKVFLIVDNICKVSTEVVQKILELGVGPGSKVVLIAQNYDVLKPFLRIDGDRYVCDSICMPKLVETEALELFAQIITAGRGFPYRSGMKKDLTPEELGFALPIFRSVANANLLYLPVDIENFAKQLLKNIECEPPGLLKYQSGCKEVKEDPLALLDQKHQLLFLDISLFILPAQTWSLSQACEVLCLMHGCTSEEMQEMIEELERCDFLRTSSSGFYVPDALAQFVIDIQADNGQSFLGWTWRHYELKAEEKGEELLLRQDNINENCQVRTMILEVGEGCKKVCLKDFSGLKALALRNSKSLEMLSLVGLSSLVSFNAENYCSSLKPIKTAFIGDLSIIEEPEVGDEYTIFLEAREILSAHCRIGSV